ncbi:hypothetical protein CEXT_661441 [Caerostris extrusa]|uniref:ATP synthase F0 subunit 8 n=1 Tax=Caerostris extrusa TaxID=172846 RepID=A0AAV4PNZ5_CAEEX|nr:hypothetical protein CEXT_661441 [Caerostris extrusa]
MQFTVYAEAVLLLVMGIIIVRFTWEMRYYTLPKPRLLSDEYVFATNGEVFEGNNRSAQRRDLASVLWNTMCVVDRCHDGLQYC